LSSVEEATQSDVGVPAAVNGHRIDLDPEAAAVWDDDHQRVGVQTPVMSTALSAVF
jgi:hypothetical protein